MRLIVVLAAHLLRTASMLLKLLRRMILGVGYRLPPSFQRRFHERLYDGPRPDPGRLAMTAADAPDRLIRFEFIGGCRDGQVYSGEQANPFFWQADHGTMGARFSVPTVEAVEAMLGGEPTGPILNQEYEVVENRTENEVTHIRARSTRGVGRTP